MLCANTAGNWRQLSLQRDWTGGLSAQAISHRVLYRQYDIPTVGISLPRIVHCGCGMGAARPSIFTPGHTAVRQSGTKSTFTASRHSQARHRASPTRRIHTFTDSWARPAPLAAIRICTGLPAIIAPLSVCCGTYTPFLWSHFRPDFPPFLFPSSCLLLGTF